MAPEAEALAGRRPAAAALPAQARGGRRGRPGAGARAGRGRRRRRRPGRGEGAGGRGAGEAAPASRGARRRCASGRSGSSVQTAWSGRAFGRLGVLGLIFGGPA